LCSNLVALYYIIVIVKLNSLGDGSVDVGHNDLIVPLPQVDVRRASLGPLELGSHRVHHLVLTRLQIQLLLQ